MFSLRLWLEKTAPAGWESISLDGRKIRDIYSLYWTESPPELEEDIRPEELTGYEEIDFSAYRKPPAELLSGWLEQFYKYTAG
jgi:hypothetical protein